MYKNNQAMSICKFYKKYNRTNKDFSKYLSKDSSGKITIHKAFEIKISSKDNICDFASGFTFENCVFEKECRFEYMVFGDKELAQKKRLTINFKNCEFQSKVYFTNCVFNGEVCFNNSIFKDYADFHESIFNDTASFYNTTFESAPNFSTCVFKNIRATNFINANIKHIDMNSIETFIEERKADKDYVSDRDLDYKIRYANNARDSFRTIKDVLIANNNLLDASQWHKLELYAREIEMINKRAGAKRYDLEWCKYFIDYIQLTFYRHTSDHHTDLLKIINNVLLLISLFAIFVYLSQYIVEPYEQIISNVLSNTLEIVIISLIIALIFFKLKKSDKSGTYKELYRLFYELLLLIFITALCMLILLTISYIISLIVTSSINHFQQYLNINLFVSIAYYFCFITIYCGLVFMNTKVLRGIVLLMIYIIFAILIATNSKAILPIFGILLSDCDKPILMGISVVYSILAFLLIFSLQKTARKNSIIPN